MNNLDGVINRFSVPFARSVHRMVTPRDISADRGRPPPGMNGLRVALFVICFSAGLLLGFGPVVAVVHAQEEEVTPTQEEGSAPTEAQNGQKFGKWVFTCTAISATKSYCRLVQTLFIQKSGQQILQAELGGIGPNGESGIQLLFPLGTLLKTPVTMQIDEKDASAIPWVLCNGRGCFAAILLDENTLSAMRSGKQMVVSFGIVGGQAYRLGVSLGGVTAGLKALGI